MTNGKIFDVENLGSVILIHVKRTGLRRLWDQLVGASHAVPFDHRMFYNMMESLECKVDGLIGQHVEFTNQNIYFSEL